RFQGVRVAGREEPARSREPQDRDPARPYLRGDPRRRQGREHQRRRRQEPDPVRPQSGRPDRQGRAKAKEPKPMKITLKELAEMTHGDWEGDGGLVLTGAAGLLEASVQDVSFLGNAKYT